MNEGLSAIIGYGIVLIFIGMIILQMRKQTLGEFIQDLREGFKGGKNNGGTKQSERWYR